MQNEISETLTVQEMAARSGMSAHTLRYYEQIGLITPIPRDNSSGHRRYQAETVRVIEALSCLRKCGLSIEAMREFMTLRRQGREAVSQQKALFQAHLNEVEAEIEQLQIRKRYLETKVAYWSALEANDDEQASCIALANREIARKLR